MSFIEDIRESEFREIFHFWRAHRKNGRVPARSAIDPSLIPPRLLPHMFIYARQKDGRFLCRLVGTAVNRIHGRDDTGRYLEEALPPEAALQRKAVYDQVLQTGMPAYLQGLEFTAKGDQRQCALILMPLASKGRRADQILGLARFGPREYAAARSGAMPTPAEAPRIRFATADDLEITAAAAPDGAVWAPVV